MAAIGISTLFIMWYLIYFLAYGQYRLNGQISIDGTPETYIDTTDKDILNSDIVNSITGSDTELKINVTFYNNTPLNIKEIVIGQGGQNVSAGNQTVITFPQEGSTDLLKSQQKISFDLIWTSLYSVSVTFENGDIFNSHNTALVDGTVLSLSNMRELVDLGLESGTGEYEDSTDEVTVEDLGLVVAFPDEMMTTYSEEGIEGVIAKQDKILREEAGLPPISQSNTDNSDVSTDNNTESNGSELLSTPTP